MTDGFIRKKVESLTLGEKLIKLRSQYRMSLVDISKATRIQVKYLEALESGDHRDLPAEVYVRGFLRSYARYLGLEDDAFIKLYDKEKHIREHLGKEEVKPEPKSLISGKAWVITPRTVLFTAIALILFGTFWYLFSELRAFVAEPHLVITTPTPGQVVSEGSVVVVGKTDLGAQISLNGEPVFVDAGGAFQEKITLQPGSNILKVAATNRFDKTKEVVLTIENNAAVAMPQLEAIAVRVLAKAAIEEVTLEADGVVVWNGPWDKGKEEEFRVQDRLKIASTDVQLLSLQVGEVILPLPSSEEGEVTYGRAELEKIKTGVLSQ